MNKEEQWMRESESQMRFAYDNAIFIVVSTQRHSISVVFVCYHYHNIVLMSIKNDQVFKRIDCHFPYSFDDTNKFFHHFHSCLI